MNPHPDESIRSCKPVLVAQTERPNFARGDYLLPALLLKDRALQHNIELMAAFCEEHDLSIAPHAKTTMAPQLVERQIAAGAWGITTATAAQARLFRLHGISTIVIANELVEPAAIAWVADELANDPSCRILSLVDSVAGVAIMDETARRLELARPLEVLVELGFHHGRTGCRTVAEALDVAEAIDAANTLRLAGIECYEGTITEETVDATLGRVDELLRGLRSLGETLDAGGAFADTDEVIVSAGGSAFFDRVVAILGHPWTLTRPVRLVLRSGCYVTHDSGIFSELSPFDGRASGPVRLQPALEVWGAVLSRPEPDLALIGFGRRDVPDDHGLPSPTLLRRKDGSLTPAPPLLHLTELNDQHAYLRGDCSELAVGDWLGCGISHPCTAFDKWRQILLVDDDYAVLDVIETFF